MDPAIRSNNPNYTTLCRLCLCEDVYMFPIFNETNIYLPQRIAACVNVEVYRTDNISTLICKQCLNKINDWHEFKKYCNESQSKLQYWSSLCGSNDPINLESIQIKEEIIHPEEIIISDNVNDSIHNNHEDFPCNEEYINVDDPVSTRMYFSPDDENGAGEPEPETLLVPTYALTPDAHGIINPLNLKLQPQQPPPPPKLQKAPKPTTSNANDIVDIKISQVFELITCRICDMNCSTKSHRSRHERLEHMVNFKDIKCFSCNRAWHEETELLEHFHMHHSLNSTFVKPENRTLKNGYAYGSLEQSHEYLKEFTQNLTNLRTNRPGAKSITLNAFEYYNQCIQKIIDRNSLDPNTTLEAVLGHLLDQNLIIKNSCHQCCISFKNVGEFKQHISKRYCKKRVRLVESGEIKTNQHFQCKQCDRIFGCKIVLTHHIRTDHNVEKVPQMCYTCHKYFPNKQDYVAHVQEKCSYLLYCSICDLVFDTTDAFNRHSSVHVEIDTTQIKKELIIYNRRLRAHWNNQCCLCPKSYRNYHDLDAHFKKHHLQFDLKTCQYCGDNFIAENEIQRHKNNYHFKGNVAMPVASQMFYCGECNSVFRTIEELQVHQTIHSDSNSNTTSNEFSDYYSPPPSLETKIALSFPCTICMTQFRHHEDLKKHIITKHKDGKSATKNPFQCLSCKKSFNNNKSLVQHNAQKHGISFKKNQPVTCLKCNTKFKDAKSASDHVRQNRCKALMKKYQKVIKVEDDDYNERGITSCHTHPCIVCKKAFTSKRSLIGHARAHFPIRKLEGIQCQLCNKISESVEELLNHFQTHPNNSLSNYYSVMLGGPPREPEPEPEQEAHTCSLCGKTLSTKFGLTMHIEVKHKRQQPRTVCCACVVCERKFPTQDDLVNHVRAHIAKNQLFSCATCNQSFLVDDYLIHTSKRHGRHICVLCNRPYSQFSKLMAHKNSHFRDTFH